MIASVTLIEKVVLENRILEHHPSEDSFSFRVRTMEKGVQVRSEQVLLVQCCDGRVQHVSTEESWILVLRRGDRMTY